jgi:hypothetical protein
VFTTEGSSCSIARRKSFCTLDVSLHASSRACLVVVDGRRLSLCLSHVTDRVDSLNRLIIHIFTLHVLHKAPLLYTSINQIIFEHNTKTTNPFDLMSAKLNRQGSDIYVGALQVYWQQ